MFSGLLYVASASKGVPRLSEYTHCGKHHLEGMMWSQAVRASCIGAVAARYAPAGVNGGSSRDGSRILDLSRSSAFICKWGVGSSGLWIFWLPWLCHSPDEWGLFDASASWYMRC